MAEELNRIVEHIHDYQNYLISTVGLQQDFLGRDWLKEQADAVKNRKDDKVSYLFTRLFWQGFVTSKILPANFGQGVNKIYQMLRNQYKNLTFDHDVNKRFFWKRQDDFEGLWSELILLDYFTSQGITSEPNLGKRRFDIVVTQGDTQYRIEVKAIIHGNDGEFLNSRFESFLLDDKPALRLRRAFRSKAKQLGKTRQAAIAIDISLYYDPVIKILAGMVTNSLGKGFNSQIRSLKYRADLPVILFLRDPYTGLAAGCLVL
ncbi:MAG: hypothetical protein WD688_24555 [Candidatus Binatia bacterium]